MIRILSAALLAAAASAAFSSPFAPEAKTEIVVYQDNPKSEGRLVVRNTGSGQQWTFPAAYSQLNRAVCTFRPFDTNALYAAWIDSNNNGKYDVGERYGTTHGRDYLAIELTEVEPTSIRLNLAAAMDTQKGYAAWLNNTNNPTANHDCFKEVAALSDRGQFNASTYVGLSEPFYMGTNMVTDYGNYVRVAILRSFINGQANDGNIVSVGDTDLRFAHYYGSDVLVERTFSLTDHPVLTEADLVAETELDLDWGGAVAVWRSAGKRVSDLTSVGYRIVVMNGTTANLETNNNLAICFENKFEAGSKQTAAANLGVQVLAGRPTFAWTHANKISKRYPAFTLQLVAPDGTVVYDSGKLRAPARDQNGVYRWTAPFSVGTMTAQGYEIMTDVDYTWRVSMLDAKFTTPNWATNDVNFTLN